MGRFFLLVILSLQLFGIIPVFAENVPQRAAKVAVVDFTVYSKGLDADLGAMVSDWFMASFAKDARFEVVERGLLKRILDEQELSMSGLVDEQTAAKVGKMLGVNVVITGAVSKIGNDLELVARAIDVETAAVVAAESGKTDDINKLREMSASVSARLARLFLAKQQNLTAHGSRPLMYVRGLIASEKMDIFNDSRVLGLLQQHGFVLSIAPAGSLEMIDKAKTGEYDFVFPSGAYIAAEISRDRHLEQTYSVFYTPIVLTSWKSVAAVLEANGVVEERDGVYFLKMQKLSELIVKGTRWSDLRKNKAYASEKAVSITCTDIATSNSGAMYLAIASYIQNGNRTVASEDEIRTVAPFIKQLFSLQADQYRSSQEPFDDYMAMGMGAIPLLFTYESEFLEELYKGTVTDEMVMLYLEPTIYVKSVLVPLSEGGHTLGQFLQKDPAFLKITAEYGYRSQPKLLKDVFKDKAVKLPNSLIEIINPPSINVLNAMIKAVKTQ